MAKNADAFALLQRALTSNFPHPNLGALPNAATIVPALRKLARYKVVQSRTFAMDKRWDKAANARLDILQMSNGISRGGSLLPFLVRFATEATAMIDFETIIPHLSAAQCRQLNARFEKLAAGQPLFAGAVSQERDYYQFALGQTWKQSAAGGKFEDGTPIDPATLERRKRGIFERNNELAKAFSAQVEKPQLSQKPVPAPNEEIDPLNYDFYRRVHLAAFGYTRSKTYFQSQQFHLALYAFHLRKRAYPATLQELMPCYLHQLPPDPFGAGELWHYKKDAATFLLWSVGPDGKDDGGKPVLPLQWHSRVVLTEKSVGDLVIRP